MNPFDYVNSITSGTTDIMDQESTYSPYMVNRALSYFPDTIFHASEMNRLWNTPARMQYDFLRRSIRKRKRFSKWFKAEKSEDIDVVRAEYGYTIEKARGALKTLTKEELAAIKQKHDVGGRR
jgi:hypothetical protein